MGIASKLAATRLVTCPGSLIVHADGTIAGCTEDDERDRCRGRSERHDGGTERCIGALGAGAAAVGRGIRAAAPAH